MTEATSMNCEDALRRLAEYLDGELGRIDEAAVHHHLDHCRSCYSRAEFEKRLKTQVGALRQGTVDAGLEQRVHNLLDTFRTNEPGA